MTDSDGPLAPANPADSAPAGQEQIPANPPAESQNTPCSQQGCPASRGGCGGCPQEPLSPDESDGQAAINDNGEPAPSAQDEPVISDGPMTAPESLQTASQPAYIPEVAEGGFTIVVRYGAMQHIGEFKHNLASMPAPGAKVVVRTERGVEIGTVVLGVQDTAVPPRIIARSQLIGYIRASAPEYVFHRGGRILRVANQQDIVDQRHLDASAREESTYCRQQIREARLNMRLVTAEHLLGGERIIFYFSSEARVDFRELVRKLAAQFRTRIEMRQVGARDEARLVGDYERCGQRCCCQQYLKDLRPVSMRMAKTQKATLDPTKISGRCGRLMCCLRHEDATYDALRAQLPRKNTWVKTAQVIGKVIDSQIISQLVRLLLPDGSQTVVANEEILERDLPAQPMLARPEPREAPKRRDRSEMRKLRDDAAAPAATGGEGSEAGADEPVTAPALPDENAPMQERPSADLPDESQELAPPGVEGDGEAPLSQGQPPHGREHGPQGEGREGRRRRRRRHGRGGGGGQGQGQGQGQPRAAESFDAPHDGGGQGGGDQNGDGGGTSEPRQFQQRPPGQGGRPDGQGGGRHRRRRRHRGGRHGGGGGQGNPGGSGGQGGGGAPQGGGGSDGGGPPA